jgi:hypothetical protein
MKRPPPLTRQQINELRHQGFAPNEHALQRLIDAARNRRASALMRHGIQPSDAKAQAWSEFAHYDLIEFHESGWVRIRGINFYQEYESSS